MRRFSILWSRVKFVALVLIAVLFLAYSVLTDFIEMQRQIEACEVFQRNIPTGLGQLTYMDLHEMVYSKRDYSLCPNNRCNNPFVQLYSHTQCTPPPEEWLGEKPSRDPSSKVNVLPEKMSKDFLLNGTVRMIRMYVNQSDAPESASDLRWTKADVESHLKMTEERAWVGHPYAQDAKVFYDAMEKHNPKGRGLIIGSEAPWAEALALHFGASHVSSSGTRNIKSEDKRIDFVPPRRIAENWDDHSAKYDFAVLFSRIDHLGLGQSGSSHDPEADLKLVSRLGCLVKPGGQLFLSLPTGRDALFFDSHRIYGSVRWPMVIANWRPLDFFHHYGKNVPKDVSTEQLLLALDGRLLVSVLTNDNCNSEKTNAPERH